MVARNKSFTLIEMLIVIVIIGILAAALVPRLQAVQGRARDTQRKSDLRQIYNANEIYLLDNGKYARAGGTSYNVVGFIHSTSTGTRSAALSGGMTSVPVDPINNIPGGRTTGNFSYTYGNVFTQNVAGKDTYDLIAQLENPTDPDRCGVKQYKYNSTNPIVLQNRCGSFSPLIYDYSPDNGVN